MNDIRVVTKGGLPRGRQRWHETEKIEKVPGKNELS